MKFPMRWRKRLRQWIAVLRLAHGEGVKIPWLGLLSAVLSGIVPRSVWRARMRRCMTCPLYSTVQPTGTTKGTDRLHLCKSSHPSFVGLGCHCAVNVAAASANPHGKGCYGRDLDDDLGWPAYDWPSRRAKWRAVICFILDIRY
jgi:hypothetical protein